MITLRKLKRNNSKPFFFRIFVLTILVSLSVLLIIGNFKIKQKREFLYQKAEVFKKEIDRLLQEKKTLQTRISQTQNPDFLEKIAREDLNLKKIGEKVVAFPILKEREKEQKEREKNLWQKFLEKFKIK